MFVYKFPYTPENLFMKYIILTTLIISSLSIYGQGENAVLSPCTDALLPIVEIQINNTASNHDDYGSTANYTMCTARVINVTNSSGNANFPGGVSVELRNPSTMSNLTFSVNGDSDPGSASIFAVLPEDGDWFTFFIKGNFTSTIDKTAIIEIATAGATCNDVVLARKALMIPSSGSSPISPDFPHVEIEVGSVSTLDDYLTWSPKLCRIRLASAPPPLITFRKPPSATSFVISHASYIESSNLYTDNSGTSLNITLQNMTGTNRLRFANSSLMPGHTATDATLTLSLPDDGTWVYFYMAGNFNNASISDKDAVMEVIDSDIGLLLSREGVMVRIRKNANTLTTAEGNRFLEALKKMDLTYNDYIDFVKTHSRDNTGVQLSKIASRQAHAGSAFLPWHRAYILHLERLLQAADPGVALPYWKFDANAPQVFNENFMGSNSDGNMVILSATNPIVSWTLPGEGVLTGIQRKTPYGDNGHPKVASETATLGLGSPSFSFSSFKSMERTFHNPAHSKSGSTSWLVPQYTSNRDPLFFLLHSNVDRVWAKWQWMHSRYNMNDTLSYDLQGSFDAPAPGVLPPDVSANRTLGQYADDTMWPWDNITGGSGAAKRPRIAVLTPFPVTLNSTAVKKPTVKSMIDYLGITSSNPGDDLGFGFDDFFPY
jgi:tyrosinase